MWADRRNCEATMPNPHISAQKLRALHQPKDGDFEKGCLTRHEKRTENHQCSHQWQAKQKAIDTSSMYDYPKYRYFCGSGTFETATRESKKNKGTYFPRDYGVQAADGTFHKKKPKKGEWDVGHGKNFDHFLEPYWHNAHHLVPNGALKNSINKQSSADERLPGLIRQGLLRGEYNLNGPVNMVILPQEYLVARALGLPRHLKGDKVGPGEDAEVYSHTDYSKRVELRLNGVMRDYKNMFKSYLADKHPATPAKLSKEKVEKLSKDIFAKIETLAKKYAGKALSNLPHIVPKK